MAQITSGIRAMFSYPTLYNVFQNVVGAPHARSCFVHDYLKIDGVSRLLDIGCGTAELVRHLPEIIDYVGFDTSTKYIEAAQRTMKRPNAQFIAKEVTGTILSAYDPFDRVTATGLLHHLEDGEVLNVFQLAKGTLKDDGFFVSIDPCYVVNQSWISKMLVERDRGKNVRTLASYKYLAESIFTNVVLHHRNDLLRIPYDHAVLVCS